MNFPRLTNQKMYKLVLYRMIHWKKHEIDSYSLLITWAHFPIMISNQWLTSVTLHPLTNLSERIGECAKTK